MKKIILELIIVIILLSFSSCARETEGYNDIDYIALMPIKANKDGSASIMLYSYYTTSLDMNQIIYFSMRYRLFYMMRYEVIF